MTSHYMKQRHFQIKKKPKQLMPHRPALQEMLTEVLQAEGK